MDLDGGEKGAWQPDGRELRQGGKVLNVTGYVREIVSYISKIMTKYTWGGKFPNSLMKLSEYWENKYRQPNQPI